MVLPEKPVAADIESAFVTLLKAEAALKKEYDTIKASNAAAAGSATIATTESAVASHHIGLHRLPAVRLEGSQPALA